MFPSPALVRRRLLVWSLLCIIALVILTAQVRSPDGRRIGWIGTAVEAVLAPPTAALARAGGVLADAWGFISEIGTLRTENQRLKAEVARLREENARLRPDAQENVRLRTLLGFKQQLPYRSLAARIVGRDPSQWFSTVLIDRGASEGVARDDPVITSDGVVGHVVETQGSWARVLLVADPRSAVSVVLDRSREVGVAVGQGQTLLKVTYLSRDADVRQGDVVLTSGLGPIYPRGLSVGSVVSVSRTTMFQEAVVRPTSDLGHLEDVLVVLRGGPQPAR
ncbi:MAG TPA: rod shape-determining protein MreC [bacterium]|nr:rod shape-determining protein MreC [bacterium]